MEKKGSTPEVVSSLMEGDYFLALAEKETRKADGAVFYRTIRGRFVRESDVELRNPDVVRGEELGRDGWHLPLAFVWGEDRETCSISKGEKASGRWQGAETRALRGRRGTERRTAWPMWLASPAP